MFKSKRENEALRAELSKKDAEIQRLHDLLPTGRAGMAALTAEDIFTKWEQTGLDPTSEVQTYDADIIGRSAITVIVNGFAEDMVKKLPPNELIQYIEKYNPELLKDIISAIPLETLAQAIARNVTPTVLNAWLTSNGNVKEFLYYLEEAELPEPSYEIALQEIEKTNTVKLLELPVGTEIGLYTFIANADWNDIYHDLPEPKNALHPDFDIDTANSYVELRIVFDAQGSKIFRVSTSMLDKNQQLNKQLPATLLCNGFEPNTVMFGKRYTVLQEINSSQRQIPIGKLLQVTIS